jgi:hypothetical protein
VTLLINRVVIYLGLLLLALFAVMAIGNVLVQDSGCDECCSSGTCTDCQDCQCAFTASFMPPAYGGSELFMNLNGTNALSSHFIPEREWFSDFDRPPRYLSV